MLSSRFAFFFSFDWSGLNAKCCKLVRQQTELVDIERLAVWLLLLYFGWYTILTTCVILSRCRLTNKLQNEGEVGQLDLSFHVAVKYLGFDVSMYQIQVMECLNRVCDLVEHVGAKFF